jgi:hypothetical protein
MRESKLATALLILGLIGSASGCRKRAVQAAPPVVVGPMPQPKPAPTHPEPKPQSAPETQPAPAPGSSAPTSAPKKPGSAPPASKETPEPEPAPAKPAPPQISPQVSPEEQAADEHKTKQNIEEAEKNLRRAYGRELSAAQHDLVEKISNFLTQSREAIRNSDWARARNLSQKAYLLSVELANSL